MTQKQGSGVAELFGFRATDMDEAENYAAWSHALSLLFEVDPGGRRPEDGPFFGDLLSCSLGPVVLGRSRFAPQRYRRTAATIARSNIDHIVIQQYVTGGFVGAAPGRQIRVRSGDICVLDLASTFETHTQESETLNLIVPRSLIVSALANPGALHGLVIPGESASARIIGMNLASILDSLGVMKENELRPIALAATSLVRALLRGVLEESAGATASGPGPSLFELRHFIEDRLAEPDLNVSGIATAFGLSRATLYRVFEPLGGIAGYIRRRRLHRAFSALTTPDGRPRRIGGIARQWQLGNEASFARSFRSEYGITPSAARALTGSRVQARVKLAHGGHQIAPLSEWLLSISGDWESLFAERDPGDSAKDSLMRPPVTRRPD